MQQQLLLPRVVFMDRISRDLLRANRQDTFVFGDNTIRDGYGGQAAAMRGEPNAVGIRVKTLPSLTESSFWDDRDFDLHKMMIDMDLTDVEKRLRAHPSGQLVVPKYGIGTGLAQLPQRAPQTYKYLCSEFERRFGACWRLRP